MGTFSAHCRNTAVAGLISLVASSCSIVLLMQITDMIAPGGLLGSIRLLVGGCFHMQWGANFQPVKCSSVAHLCGDWCERIDRRVLCVGDSV